MDKYQDFYILPAESVVIQTLYGIVEAWGGVSVSMSVFDLFGGRLSDDSRKMLDRLCGEYGLTYEEDRIGQKVKIWQVVKQQSRTI